MTDHQNTFSGQVQKRYLSFIRRYIWSHPEQKLHLLYKLACQYIYKIVALRFVVLQIICQCMYNILQRDLWFCKRFVHRKGNMEYCKDILSVEKKLSHKCIFIYGELGRVYFRTIHALQVIKHWLKKNTYIVL